MLDRFPHQKVHQSSRRPIETYTYAVAGCLLVPQINTCNPSRIYVCLYQSSLLHAPRSISRYLSLEREVSAFYCAKRTSAGNERLGLAR